MIIRQSTATRVPIRLIDSTGAAITGATGASFLSGNISVVKSDGTLVDIAVSASGGGQNLFEINATKAPGLYHFTLTAASVDTLGPVQWSAVPAGGQTWTTSIGAGLVENAASNAATLVTRLGTPAGASIAADIASNTTSLSTITTRIGTPAQTSVSNDIANLVSTVGTPFASTPQTIAGNLTAINTATGNITAIKTKTDNLPAAPANETTVAAIKAKTDNLPTDPADQSDLAGLVAAVEGTGFNTVSDSLAAISDNVAAVKVKTDALPASFASSEDVAAVADAVWDADRAAHTAMGTYGELMRLLMQAYSGRIKVDASAGTLTIFSEDNATPLQIQFQLDANGEAAGLAATERLAATPAT